VSSLNPAPLATTTSFGPEFRGQWEVSLHPICQPVKGRRPTASGVWSSGDFFGFFDFFTSLCIFKGGGSLWLRRAVVAPTPWGALLVCRWLHCRPRGWQYNCHHNVVNKVLSLGERLGKKVIESGVALESLFRCKQVRALPSLRGETILWRCRTHNRSQGGKEGDRSMFSVNGC
jgi:hypothetical protein